METTNTTSAPAAAAPRIRSVAYPSYPISSCTDAVRKIDVEFTDVIFTPREQISVVLGMSGGGLDGMISTCVQYGLLELKSKEGYRPSQLYKKIKRPLPTENVADFLRECLNHPPLYKKLLAEFNDKQLPSATGLSNILDRKFSVVGDASIKAAKVFLKNLENLELIGPDNILNLSGAITPTEDAVEDTSTPPPPDANQPPLLLLNAPEPTKPTTAPPISSDLIEFIDIPIFLKGGRQAKLVVPKDFTDEDMVRVSKVVNGYLP